MNVRPLFSMLSFLFIAQSPSSLAFDQKAIPTDQDMGGARLQSIVIEGPGSAGTTYSTGSGTPLPVPVTFQDGTQVRFVPTTPIPRTPAAELPPKEEPVPYNVWDYRENPLDKAQYYFPNPIK